MRFIQDDHPQGARCLTRLRLSKKAFFQTRGQCAQTPPKEPSIFSNPAEILYLYVNAKFNHLHIP
jgi:hypothetical protein